MSLGLAPKPLSKEEVKEAHDEEVVTKEVKEGVEEKVDSAIIDTVENEEEKEEEFFTTAILLPTIELNDAKPQPQLEKESQEQNLEPHSKK
eukprot:1760389-Ditylum_brightwellii.AAC.1